MSEIRFDLRWREDLGVSAVVPRVDGRPLTELVDRFEVEAGMHPAGDAYDGLIPGSYELGPMEDHYHGRFHGYPPGGPGPRTPVLACRCGDWGCWPLMARIRVADDLVTWDSFEQPHRKTRDYGAFGPFRFDRHQYDSALHDLTAALDARR